MKAVGVKKLKTHLSEYLRLVRAGETVLVTDRDEVIAELRPATRQPLPADTLEARLERLGDGGSLTRTSSVKGDWTWSVRGLGLPAGTAHRLLEDLRSER